MGCEPERGAGEIAGATGGLCREGFAPKGTHEARKALEELLRVRIHPPHRGVGVEGQCQRRNDILFVSECGGSGGEETCRGRGMGIESGAVALGRTGIEGGVPKCFHYALRFAVRVSSFVVRVCLRFRLVAVTWCRDVVRNSAARLATKVEEGEGGGLFATLKDFPLPQWR